jgi:phosphoglycolate phosphatase
LFYALSFIALALPIGVDMRGVLWTIFFGLAKTTQYTGLAILGAEGVKRLKKMFRRESGKEE